MALLQFLRSALLGALLVSSTVAVNIQNTKGWADIDLTNSKRDGFTKVVRQAATAAQPGNYTIHLIQKINGQAHSLEWTLLDTTGQKIAGPGRADLTGSIPGTPSRSELLMKVNFPTDHVKTSVDFILNADAGDGIPCTPVFGQTLISAGASFVAPCKKGNAKGYKCTNPDFNQTGTAFTREFDCMWVDFGKP